jgi:hypothetical protein
MTRYIITEPQLQKIVAVLGEVPGKYSFGAMKEIENLEILSDEPTQKETKDG